MLFHARSFLDEQADGPLPCVICHILFIRIDHADSFPLTSCERAR